MNKFDANMSKQTSTSSILDFSLSFGSRIKLSVVFVPAVDEEHTLNADVEDNDMGVCGT